MANYNERITVQYVSDLDDVQKKIRVWVSRAVSNGFKETSSENQAELKRRSKQGVQLVIVVPIIMFLYGSILYGGVYTGIVYGLLFGACALCSLPFTKPTVVATTWNNEPPYCVTVDATGSKGDFKNVVEDLRYVLSTDPGTSIQ